MIKCPGCGGEVQFDVKTQKVKCKYCGNSYEVEEVSKTVKNADTEEANFYEGKSYKCTQCGAKLMAFDDTAITFCSYCGSQAMLEDKMIKQNDPDVVIPFQKTKEECVEAYKKKISGFYFAPKYMTSDTIVEKFRGIYMPYGMYHLTKKGDIHESGKKYSHRSGDYVYYDLYSITASGIDISYDGVCFDLVSKFYDNFSTSIPFHADKTIPFNPAYMAGFYADLLDVKREVYDAAAKEVVRPDAQSRLKRTNEFSKYGCSSPNVDFVCDSKVGMFPIYFLAIRNAGNDAIHYAVVNGQTGEVAIEMPIDFKKYIGVALIVSLVVFLLMEFLDFTLSPGTVLGFSIFASIMSLIYSKSQLNKIKAKREHSSDRGIQSTLKEAKEKEENKEEAKKKTKKSNEKKYHFLFKEIIAIVISTIVLFVSPVDDKPYYITAIVSLVLVLLSFSDLVKEHNLLVSNPLPQLEKRGGEENA